MKGDIPKPTKTYLLFIKILIIPRRQRQCAPPPLCALLCHKASAM